MTNKTILTYAFLDAVIRHHGGAFRLWHEMPEEDQRQHLITAQLFLDHPMITPQETHEAWVTRRAAEGWRHGDNHDPEARLHPDHLPFAELPKVVQESEAAGVDAMRAALPHAQANRLPPDLAFEVMKRIAVGNANLYLEVGATLGLDTAAQPSEMLLWGSLANARHHMQILMVQDAFSTHHGHLVNGGIVELESALGKPGALEQATPGGHRDTSLLNCSERHLEHGRFTQGSVFLTEVFSAALDRASAAGYCDRCLVASQIGDAVSALITGMRQEGRDESDIIEQQFARGDLQSVPTHSAGRKEVLQ